MFANANNNRFKNTSFTMNTLNVNASSGQGLGILHRRVASNAIRNAGGRADEVRCHPGTRTEVMGVIDKWRLDIHNDITANQIFWLTGPAGAGKTAIVQTLAESWKSKGIHTASFFFFRTDPSRCDAKTFISTLLYQIFDFVPAARQAVDKVLSLKPPILEAGLEEQVDELICTTFRSIQPSFTQRIVLLIDGLDECDSETKTSQKQILHVLDNLVRQEDLPFLVLVASRTEPHISAAFRQLTSKTQSIFLDDEYSPETDIRLFVTAEFENIKKSHPHAALLPSDWPSPSDIDSIVWKSSGQFIYPATVMRFIAQPSAVPDLSLQKVQGIVPFAKNSPFNHLDAFYTYILQQADDAQAICDILSSALLDQKPIYYSLPPECKPYRFRGMYPSPMSTKLCHTLPPLDTFLQIFDSRYTESFFVSCISDISSIVSHDYCGRLTFHHASLSDFLRDRSRSLQFHVDLDTFIAKVLVKLWSCQVTIYHPKYPPKCVPLGLHLLHLVSHTTPAITTITKQLLTVHPSDLDQPDQYFKTDTFLQDISQLYYPHDIATYRQILQRWITWAMSYCDSGSSRPLRSLEGYCEPATGKWGGRVTPWEGDPKGGIPLLRRYLYAARLQRKYGTVISRVLAWGI